MSRPRIRPLRAWTLRTKLLTAVIGLLTVVCLLIGVFTVVALRTYLVGRVDQDLDRMVDAPYLTARYSGGIPDLLRGPQAPGTIGAVKVGNEIVASGVIQDRTVSRLTTAEMRALEEATVANVPSTHSVGALGNFRLVAVPVPGGNQVIIGQPLTRIDETVTQLGISLTMIGLSGLLAAGLVGTWIVGHSLQPLRRVARTAGRVAELPLDRGEVALAERVPAADTDPHTEIGQVGSALNHMLDHIDSALAARQASEMRVRQFVADASHELRTPLAAIRGYSEVTRRGGQEVPPDVAHAMSRVESETERMTTLVDDLLLLARLDSGRPLDREPVDLSHVVIDAVSDAHVAGPDHQWTLELPDEPVEVTGDPHRLHQVLANLLANARTHTPPGTKVTVGLANDGDGNVQLTVVDNGPGIPESLQPDIFERFARGDSSRSRAAGSTGLGLAIVAAVVEAHHGTVRAESRPGRTVFTVTLPATS